MTTYAVKAETHEGKIMTLRSGFPTAEVAEDHPVTLSLWKRVWVEPVDAPVIQPPVLPPKPWNWVTSGSADHSGQFHAYLVDATGKKIAAIWGGNAKAMIADHILDCVNSKGGN